MTDEFRRQVIEVVPILRARAQVLTKNTDAANDLVQDVIVRAFEKEEQYTLGTNIQAWLMTIMRNRFLGEIRRMRAAPFETMKDDDERHLGVIPAPQDSVVLFHQMMARFNRLPRDQQVAISAIAIDGLSYDDAAEQVGVEVGTIKSRVSRGRAALEGSKTMNADVDHEMEMLSRLAAIGA